MDALILSCGTGGGHNAAGHAVEDELLRRGHRVTFLNPYTLVSQKLADTIDAAYVKMAQRAPHLFGLVYRLGDLYRKLPVKSPVYHVNKKMVPVLAQYLEEHPVDVIFMPHLFPAEILTQMKKQGYKVPLTIFIATDYTCIPFTEETDCDAYVIAHRHLTAEYVKAGIAKEKLYPFGIPVRKEFPCPLSVAEARKKLGLKEEKQYVLLFGGSIGAGKVEIAARMLHRHFLGRQPGTELIVICGSNRRLYRRLSKSRCAKSGMTVLSYTEQMAAYMRACDVVVGKPGGLSSTEAAVTQTSLLFMPPIPGCESHNLSFFTRKGMGIGCFGHSSRELCKVCDTALKKEIGERMMASQRLHIAPDAAKKICDFAEANIYIS